MRLDMHFHSTASDGLLTQEELLQKATEQNLEFLALTDHDVISYGFAEAAKKLWIQSCQSVEISAYNKEHDKSLHLTLYARSIWENISQILSGVRQTKQKLIEKQIDFFISLGFFINKSEFYSFFEKIWRKKETLNKFDIVVFLFLSWENRTLAAKFNEGITINREEFYLKFLKRWGDKFEEFAVQVENYEIPLLQCKNIQQQTEGVLSLPHPNITFRKWWIEEFEDVLSHYIKNWWINAVEINAKATKEWVESILKLKDRYWFYITFWSDFHKENHNDWKHWEFWEVNSFISSDRVRKYFSEYQEKIMS